jgi:hypothetical protein
LRALGGVLVEALYAIEALPIIGTADRGEEEAPEEGLPSYGLPGALLLNRDAMYKS